jgi:insertion element IS1 protein InsB
VLYKLKQLEVEIRFTAEMDEFWSFVQNKRNQRWTWLCNGVPAGNHFNVAEPVAARQRFLTLWELLKTFPISKYHTDDWGTYSKYIPPDKH